MSTIKLKECVLVIFLFSTGHALADGSDIKTGAYLNDRGPYDPRPFDDVLIADRLILDLDYFEAKNQGWLDDGFAIGGYFSLNLQTGSENSTPHWMSETLLIGAWETLRKKDVAGRWVFGFAHDHTLGNLTTREFADRQGLVETPDDLDTSPDKTFTTLGLLAWEHEFYTGPDRGWGYRVGQIFAAGYFAGAVYLDDDRKYFLARPLATPAGAQWVGYNDIGLGANLVLWRGEYYLSMAAIDGKANRKYPQFDSLTDGRLLYLAEAGFERNVGGPDETIIRLTTSHLDLDGVNPDEGPGESVIVSATRRFNGTWAVFGRWSKSYRRLAPDYRELYSLGVAWLKPFQASHDFLGLGVFVGKPSNAMLGNEYGAELSYKLQLTQDTSLMPDLQYWHRKDPGGNVTDNNGTASERTSTWVAGLRFNFEF